MKTCYYLRLHMKITYWRLRIKTPFTFWDTRKWDMRKVCLQAFRNNGIREKLAYFSKNLQILRASNSRIPRVKNGINFTELFLYEHKHIGRYIKSALVYIWILQVLNFAIGKNILRVSNFAIWWLQNISRVFNFAILVKIRNKSLTEYQFCIC